MLGTVSQIDAGALNVGYADRGPGDGPAVILLHGWPYDIHSFVDVAPLLAAAGYRVIVPYLRGYGTTRFLSDETFRNGEQAALAIDAIELMDALEIDTAIVAGFDWGARTADIVAALWPERCDGLVSVSGYLIGNQESGKMPLPPEAELQWWYQYYFATERGRAGYEKYRRRVRQAHLAARVAEVELRRRHVRRAARRPSTIRTTSRIVIHNYRWRLGLAEGEPAYASSRSGSPKARSSPCPRSRSRATPTARRTPIRVLRREVRRPVLAPDRSRAASDTTSPRRLRRRSPTPSSKWDVTADEPASKPRDAGAKSSPVEGRRPRSTERPAGRTPRL